MINFVLAGFLTSSWISVSAQVAEIPLRYYLSTPDYLNGNLAEEHIIAEVKEIGTKYIRVKRMLNAETRKKSKPAPYAWGLLHEDQLYVNLIYAYQIGSQIFIKPDIIGHYMLIIFDDETFKAFEKERFYKGANYGGGLTGFAINELMTAGGNFVDSTGEKKKIILINKDYHTVKGYKKTKNSNALLMTRSTMVDLLKKNKIEAKPGEFSYEEIIALIHELNERYAHKN